MGGKKSSQDKLSMGETQALNIADNSTELALLNMYKELKEIAPKELAQSIVVTSICSPSIKTQGLGCGSVIESLSST